MIIIKTSSDTIEILEEISKKLISKKLAACVNIIPNCYSYFFWEGNMQKNKENLALIKTIKSNEKKVYEIIKNYHNYDVPEILTIDVDNIDYQYKEWALGIIKKDD